MHSCYNYIYWYTLRECSTLYITNKFQILLMKSDDQNSNITDIDSDIYETQIKPTFRGF